jgi:hypothetical protein
MPAMQSFRFVDDDLQRQFRALLKTSGIDHTVEKDGAVVYKRDDEEIVENELISSIRNRIFGAWQILSCPKDWTNRYRAYMKENDIPYAEEITDQEICFLIPRRYRPHSWKLGGVRSRVKHALAR